MSDKLTWRRAHSVFRIIWPILLGIIAIAVLWGTFASQIDAHERRLVILEERMDILLDIQMDIRETKTDIAWLKEWAKHNGGTP